MKASSTFNVEDWEASALTSRRRSGLFLLTMMILVIMPSVVFWRDQGLPSTRWEFVEFLGFVVILVLGALWLALWRKSGVVLADCEPHPSRRLGLALGWLVMLLIAKNVTPLLMSEVIDWHGLMDELRVAPLSAICFGMACSRLQIRQHGVWAYGSLVKWEGVEEHRWSGETERTLTVEFKKPASMLGSKARFTMGTELEDVVEARIEESEASNTSASESCAA